MRLDRGLIMRYLSDNTISVADEVCSDVPVITMEAARRIVEDHGIDWQEFVNDFGSQASYNTRRVFNWLGY